MISLKYIFHFMLLKMAQAHLPALAAVSEFSLLQVPICEPVSCSLDNYGFLLSHGRYSEQLLSA